MVTANISQQALFYEDAGAPSNPQRRLVDWRRSETGLLFDEVASSQLRVPAGGQVVVDSGAVVVDLSATQVTVASVPAQAVLPVWSQLRGSFPSSPWVSAQAVVGQPLTVTAQPDGSALLSGAGLASLSSVAPGDWFYLAGAGYGDSGSVSAANQGFWVAAVVGVTGVFLHRRYDADPQPVTETVTVASALDVQHLPDAARPRWLAARGPAATCCGVWPVVGAASGWLAVAPQLALPLLTAATFQVLSALTTFRSYVRVEVDGELTVEVGDLGQSPNQTTVLPLAADVAWYECLGVSTSLTLRNPGVRQVSASVVLASPPDPTEE